MIRSHRAREESLRPSPCYLEDHLAHAGPSTGADSALTPQMRMIVVSWMVEVGSEFVLEPETLHLSVALLDRFLSSAAPMGVPRSVLQMVAVACIMVAAKHLEAHHPSVEQYASIAANCFTAHDLLRMERVLLEALDFNLTNQTAYSFLHLYVQGMPGMPAPAAALAMYLLDLVLLDYSLLQFAPSRLAAGVLLLALLTHGHAPAAPLPAHLLRLSGYAAGELAACVACLLQLHRNAAWPGSEAVRELIVPVAAKYSQQDWCCAALQEPLEPCALEGLQAC